MENNHESSDHESSDHESSDHETFNYELSMLIRKETEQVEKDYPHCNILTVYGKLFTREEWVKKIKLLFPEDNDNDNDDDDFEQDYYEDCVIDIQVKYGIKTWTWQHSETDNKAFKQFIIGHDNLYVLEKILTNNELLNSVIDKLDWFIIPGIPYETNFDMHEEWIDILITHKEEENNKC